ncbi:MAG: HEAT repeat domain-containing protein, partial [Planctomycetota bacterium]
MRWVLIVLLFALTQVRAEDEKSVAKMLRSSDPAVREQAAERLGKEGKRASVKSLLPLLKDPDWGVRLAATKAIAPISSSAGRKAMIDQLHTGEIAVIRLRTAQYLKATEDRMLPPEVARRLKSAKDERRIRLIEALGILGGPSAESALADQMKSSKVEVRMA